MQLREPSDAREANSEAVLPAFGEYRLETQHGTSSASVHCVPTDPSPGSRERSHVMDSVAYRERNRADDPSLRLDLRPASPGDRAVGVRREIVRESVRTVRQKPRYVGLNLIDVLLGSGQLVVDPPSEHGNSRSSAWRRDVPERTALPGSRSGVPARHRGRSIGRRTKSREVRGGESRRPGRRAALLRPTAAGRPPPLTPPSSRLVPSLPPVAGLSSSIRRRSLSASDLALVRDGNSEVNASDSQDLKDAVF